MAREKIGKALPARKRGTSGSATKLNANAAVDRSKLKIGLDESYVPLPWTGNLTRLASSWSESMLVTNANSRCSFQSDVSYFSNRLAHAGFSRTSLIPG